MLTPEQRHAHRSGKRTLRRLRLAQRERRQAEIAIGREWAKRLGLRADGQRESEKAP